MAGIFSVVNDILAAGVGVTDGISGLFKAEAGEIAQTIAQNASLKKFNSLGYRATGEFSVNVKNAAGDTINRSFKKGQAITAGTFDEMQQILGSNKFNGVSSHIIDTNKLTGDALEAAKKKNEALNKIINAFDNVRNDAANGRYLGMTPTMLSEVGDAAGDELRDLRTLLGRTDKQKGLGFANLATGYFGDVEKGGMRAKAVGGAAMGGAVGLRFLQGGDLTHNARGENDIAGIPFF